VMSLLEAVRWDLLSHGIQILVWAVILVYFVRKRPKSRPSGAHAETTAPTPGFYEEVLLQTIRQQTEQALQSILTAVEAERDKLQRLLVSADVPQLPVAAPIAETVAAHIPFRLGESDPELTDQSRYAGLKGLSGRGLSPRQIADQMKRPVGEIELALKLQRASESAGAAGARQ
jgi:hypothetical protein